MLDVEDTCTYYYNMLLTCTTTSNCVQKAVWNGIKDTGYMCFSKEDLIDTDSLARPISMEDIDSSLWSDKCDYWIADKCDNLNPSNYNFLVLQLNIRSLLAHQGDLCQLIRTTEKKNSRIDIILLCETFISKNTLSMVKIPGFTHVGNFCKDKKGGGVSILIHDGIAYR